MTAQCTLYMGVLKNFGTPDYAHGCYSQHFSWALPVPEIIGVPKKIWAVPAYAHAPFFSRIFNRLLFGLALYMYQIKSNLKSVALPVPEIRGGS